MAAELNIPIASPAPIIAPTSECPVEAGIPRYVHASIHIEADKIAATAAIGTIVNGVGVTLGGRFIFSANTTAAFSFSNWTIPLPMVPIT
jgi:hypothetical protein